MMTRKRFLGSLVGLLGLATLGAACTKPVDGDDDGSGGEGGGGGGGGGGGEGPDAAVSPATPDAAVMPPTMACATTSASISFNHGHAITVSAEEVEEGVDKTYNIKGTASHPHTVTITAAMFATLKSSKTMMVTSSSDAGHSHAVTVTCAA